MDPRYKSRFNDAVLAETAARFAVDPESLEELDGFESFIYACRRSGQDYILRISHSHRRTEELIHGEVDWINYLAAGGAGVARAEQSAENRLVEVIEDGQGGEFLATIFVKIHGVTPRREMMTPAFFETYGQALGRTHRLTRSYRVPNPAWKRMEWDDPIHLYTDFLPADQPRVLEQSQNLMAHLQSLPKGPDDYGLVHYDAHTGNLLVEADGTIRLFDFDDCCYSWFINDIAIVLFYAVGGEDPISFTRTFMTHFLRGYRREAVLNPDWLDEIPYFLKLREIDLYAAIYRSFDVNNLTDGWVAWYMKGRRERIEDGLPFIDFDFTTLAGELKG